MVVDPDELEALVEALIEEARQRARRRRRRRGACLAFAAFVAGGLYFGFHRSGGTHADASVARAASAGAATAVRTPGRWGPAGGPDGGPAYAVAVAPSAPRDLYLGTGRGVFRSTNGGRRWMRAGSLPAAQSWFSGATSLLVDPRSASTVYAGRNWRWAGGMAYGQAVLKTTNGGRTWRALAIHGQPIAVTTSAVYVAAAGPEKAGHLVRSTDGGRSWQPANSGLPSGYVWGLAFDPSAPAVGYAAMGRHGVFASRDSGVHWRSVGLSARYGEVTAVAVDPTQPDTVYAAADAGVVVSRDGGHRWWMLNASLGNHGRDRWEMQVAALLIAPASPDTIYATTRCAGVFKTTNGGRTWQTANTGLKPDCPWAYSLALDPRLPQTIYAADPTRGVLTSIDGAAHWQTTNAGLSLSPVSTLAVTPHAIYAATGALGLFKSNGGAHWQPLPTGLDAVYALRVDPNNPAHLLAAGSATMTRPSSAPQLAVSSDAGRTWTRAAFGGRYVSVVAINGQTAYAGSAAGLGVFGSTNGGHSWHPLGPPGVNYVQALAIDPQDNSTVYAGVYGAAGRGLYKTTDGGSTWQLLAEPLNIDIAAVALDPANPSTVYLGTPGGEGGVYKSTDGGVTWQRENTGLRWKVRNRAGKSTTPTMAITALAIDPANSTTLYAVTAPRGVYQSTDAGATWHPFNAGLSDPNVTTLALDPSGQTLYAGTSDQGVVSLHRAP